MVWVFYIHIILLTFKKEKSDPHDPQMAESRTTPVFELRVLNFDYPQDTRRHPQISSA